MDWWGRKGLRQFHSWCRRSLSDRCCNVAWTLNTERSSWLQEGRQDPAESCCLHTLNTVCLRDMMCMQMGSCDKHLTRDTLKLSCTPDTHHLPCCIWDSQWGSGCRFCSFPRCQSNKNQSKGILCSQLSCLSIKCKEIDKENTREKLSRRKSQKCIECRSVCWNIRHICKCHCKERTSHCLRWDENYCCFHRGRIRCYKQYRLVHRRRFGSWETDKERMCDRLSKKEFT